MSSVKYLIIVISLVVGSSCVEPFGVSEIGFDRAIVVEGRFTDQKHHYVKLSYTRPVDATINTPVTDAVVWVEDSEGNKIDFYESKPGYYESTEVAGRFGIRYQLFFTTAEGDRYQSSVQQLIASPAIDSIYDVYRERVNKQNSEVQKGIQLFVDTHDETSEARYFKYDWEETYEVHSPYPSLYEFSTDPDTVIRRNETVHICYASSKSSSIQVGTTAGLTGSRLSEMPVRYLSTATDHLKFTYSILVRQYAISAEAYSFYRKILDNNNDNGSFFDKQLGAVTGNVVSVSNDTETVLGFFEVSGVVDKRAFFKFEDLDPRFPWPDDQYPCEGDAVHTLLETDQPPPYKISDSLKYYVQGKGYKITIASYCDSTTVPLGPPCPFYLRAQVAPLYCSDCRFRGTTIKPSFWIY